MSSIFQPNSIRVGACINQRFVLFGEEQEDRVSGSLDLKIERQPGRWRVTGTQCDGLDGETPDIETTVVLDFYDGSMTRAAIYHKELFGLIHSVEQIRGKAMTPELQDKLFAGLAESIAGHVDRLLDTHMQDRKAFVGTIRSTGGLRDRIHEELKKPYDKIAVVTPGFLKGAQPSLLGPRIAANVGNLDEARSSAIQGVARFVGRRKSNIVEKINTATHASHTIGTTGNSISFSVSSSLARTKIRIECVRPETIANARSVDSMKISLSHSGHLIGRPHMAHHRQGLSFIRLIDDQLTGNRAGMMRANVLCSEIEKYGMEFLEKIDDPRLARRAAQALMQVHTILDNPRKYFGGTIRDRSEEDRSPAFRGGKNPFTQFAVNQAPLNPSPELVANPLGTTR